MSQTNARRAAALAAALLCFAVGMLAGVEASGGRISDILMVQTRTVAGPRTTVVRTQTRIRTTVPPPVTVIRTVTHGPDRHHHRHHPGG
jgi:hypothetical protein